MKNYKTGILFGLLGILSSLLIVGIPVINNTLAIINIICFIGILIFIILFAVFLKKDKLTLHLSLIYMLIISILTMIVEINYPDAKILYIGFLPGLIINLIGIFFTNNNKSNYKIKISLLLNIVGVSLAIISLLLTVLNIFN